MFKKSIIISIITFFFLTLTTSVIKNKARNLEKDVLILKKDISILKKQISDAEIDFIYLSNPENLIQHLEISKEHYTNFDHSRVFFSINHFISHDSKETKFYKESNLKW